MSDRRYYAKIDVGYLDNPKLGDFVDDSKGVVLLHLRAILYCAQHLTDGVFPIARVCRLAAASYCGASHHDECTMQCTMHSAVQCTEGCIPLCDWCAAASVGLVNRLDARNGEVHDYLEHQESSQRVAERSAARQRAARARWGAPKKAPRDASCIAPSSAESNADEMRRDEMRYNYTPSPADAGDGASDPPTPKPRSKPKPPAEARQPKTAPPTPPEFEEFWAAYPRKIGKAAALKAWKSATKTTHPDTIQAGIEAHRDNLAAREARFIPHPSTWLNAGRWDDEPDPLAPAVSPGRPSETDRLRQAWDERLVQAGYEPIREPFIPVPGRAPEEPPAEPPWAAGAIEGRLAERSA